MGCSWGKLTRELREVHLKKNFYNPGSFVTMTEFDVPRDLHFAPLIQIIWDFPLPLFLVVVVPLERHPRTGGQFLDACPGGSEGVRHTGAHGPGIGKEGPNMILNKFTFLPPRIDERCYDSIFTGS